MSSAAAALAPAWEVLRRQVAICGTVRDKNNLPVPGALVSATCSDNKDAPYTTVSRLDGSYFFIDLPGGAYSLTATAAGSNGSGQAKLEKDKEGTLHLVRVDLTIQG